MDYNNIMVEKPWGSEYLAYQNDNVALWVLYIKENHSTSMHCHPRKTTGLVVLDGCAEVSFLADKKYMPAISKIMIRRGLFHKITCISGGCYVLEIESPNDKTDLVRLNDNYGRTCKAYEGTNFQKEKTKDCLSIVNPSLEKSLNYSFLNKNLFVEQIDNIDTINNKKDDDLIMLLNGGFFRTIENQNHIVTLPGDVGYAKIMKQVTNQLDGVCPNTIILTIEGNKNQNCYGINSKWYNNC